MQQINAFFKFTNGTTLDTICLNEEQCARVIEGVLDENGYEKVESIAVNGFDSNGDPKESHEVFKDGAFTYKG